MPAMYTPRSTQLFLSVILLALLPGCAWFQWFQKSTRSPLVGSWTNPIGTVWMIKSDGTFDVDLTKDGQRDAWGKYTVAHDTVTLVAIGGIKPKGCDGEGVYHFKRTGDDLI